MKYYDTDRQLHFFEVCSKGDILEAEKLLRSGEIDVNFQHGINQWSALHWAAKRGHEKLCAILLQAGFSPEVIDSQGRTPYNVCNPENKAVIDLLQISSTSRGEMHDIESPREVNDNKFTPGYIKYPHFPYSKQNSLDSGSNPSSPTARGYYSYGRRDSASRTRFLLVRTSCEAGKEAFKRITLPGGSTVEELRKTVENAMKSGPVQCLLTLPDKVLIEDDSQIEAFDNCQKIDVIFGEPVQASPPRTSTTKQTTYIRRRSLQLLKRDDTPDSSEASSPTVLENFTPKFPKAVPEESAKMSEEAPVATPPPSPTLEEPSLIQLEEGDDVEHEGKSVETKELTPEEEEEEEEPIPAEPQEPAEVTTDLYFKKQEHVPTDITQEIPLSVTNQEHQDIAECSKKWTTAQQLAAVAAAVSLVGLGCYFYKSRK